MDSVEHYLEVFEALRRSKRWSTDTNILRFAALTLAASDVADPGAGVEATAKVLVEEAGGFSPLNSSIRHAVAAILIRRGLDPVEIVHRTKETLAVFKEHKLKKGGTSPYLAAMLLVMDAGCGIPPRHTVVKMKEIIDRWTADHWWLTDSGDYPMAAMHATREVSVEQLGLEVEEIYQFLQKRKFSRGNQLQLVSHLLMFSGLGPREAAQRFDRMAAALKAKGQRVWESYYDEVALLVLSGVEIEEASSKAIAYRDRLSKVKPRPQASIAFSIASGVVLAEAAQKLEGLDDAKTAANLRAVQSIIEAQQAAMIACIAATTVATSTATAS